MSELNPRKVIDDHYDSVIQKINNKINDMLEDFTSDHLIPKFPEFDYVDEESDSDFEEKTSEEEENDQSDNDFDLVEDERASVVDDAKAKGNHETTNKTENTSDKSESSDEKEKTKKVTNAKEKEEERDRYVFPIFNIDQKRVYKSLYDDVENQPTVKFRGGSTRTRDYLNRVRSKAIKEANLARKENLASYELNKDKHRFNRETSIEEMRRVLFKGKFCFVLQINYFNTQSATNLSNIYTILTDFYLDQNEIKLLKKLIEGYNSFYIKRVTKFNIPLNMDKGFILHLMKEYISQKCNWSYCGNEIMRITKKTLEIEQVDYRYSNIGDFNLSADFYPAFDFSYIKWLCIESSDKNSQDSLGGIKNLSALRNLEELKIVNMTINRDSFVGLDHLIKLELIKCKMDKLDSKILRPLKSLQILRLSKAEYPIYLSNLPSLKMLSLENVKMYNEKEGIPSLYVLSLMIPFFKRINLPNLTQLSLKSNDLRSLNQEWFSGFESLKELSLASNILENLNFTNFKCFEKLEALDLSYNRITKLEYKNFRNLKNLKALNLSNNSIQHYDLKPFQSLDNLETLFLENINVGNSGGFTGILFAGLANLKQLSLRSNRFTTFYADIFSFTPKLTCLIMDGNNFNNLDKSQFENVKHLIL